MNRRKLAIVAGIVILAAALLLLLWPDYQADPLAENEAAETELPEGLVLIDEEQIRTAEIEVAAVQAGAAVELVFPATVAASPTAVQESMRALRASSAALARRLATMSAKARLLHGSKAPMRRHSLPSLVPPAPA